MRRPFLIFAMPVLFGASVAILQTINAAPTVLTDAVHEISLPRGNDIHSGNNAMNVGYSPIFDQYYGVNGNNSLNAGFVWSTVPQSPGSKTMTLIQTYQELGLDFRAMYFNENTGDMEAVTDDVTSPPASKRVFSMGLTGSLYDGTTTQQLATLGGLGFVENKVVPAYNPGKALTYNPDSDVFYCRAGYGNEVKVISRVDGSLVRDFILDPATWPSSPQDEIVYDFIGYDSNAELLVVFNRKDEPADLEMKAYIYDVDPDDNGTAELYGTSQLDTGDIPIQGLPFNRWLADQPGYNLSYANGYLFLFSKYQHTYNPDDPNDYGYWEGFKIMTGEADQPDPPDPPEIPEPATLSLLGLSGLCLVAFRRYRRRRAKTA